MNSKFICIAVFSLLFSCGGEKETTEAPNETTQTPTDSVAMASAFTEFTTYVNSLESEIENIDSIFNKYETLKSNFSQDEKDTSFFIVKSFMHSFQISEEEMDDLSEEVQNKIEKKYTKYGFEIWYEEGMPFLMPDLKFLEKKFKKDISGELGDYLDVIKVTGIQSSGDAGLSITWDHLATIVLTCEKYINENPDSKYFEDVMGLYQRHLDYLMYGLDNTPIVDFGAHPKVLNADLAKTYERLIKDKKSITGKIIDDHLSYLQSKNFDVPYEDMKYLTRLQVDDYFGFE